MNRDGILGKKPEGLSWEEAAMFPTAILTCGMGMYQLLGLPLPDSVAAPTEDSPSILIYGGSTAMGMMAIQYAKLYLNTVHPQSMAHANPARIGQATKSTRPPARATTS